MAFEFSGLRKARRGHGFGQFLTPFLKCGSSNALQDINNNNRSAHEYNFRNNHNFGGGFSIANKPVADHR
jgi:hypothetical protein